jgi:hypothetical protein
MESPSALPEFDPTDDHVDVMSCGEEIIGTKDKFE